MWKGSLSNAIRHGGPRHNAEHQRSPHGTFVGRTMLFGIRKEGIIRRTKASVRRTPGEGCCVGQSLLRPGNPVGAQGPRDIQRKLSPNPCGVEAVATHPVMGEANLDTSLDISDPPHCPVGSGASGVVTADCRRDVGDPNGYAAKAP